jgi:hypothetical protein
MKDEKDAQHPNEEDRRPPTRPQSGTVSPFEGEPDPPTPGGIIIAPGKGEDVPPETPPEPEKP